MPIHSTAIVDPGAVVDESADIGPYCILGAGVEIGARTRLMAHVYVEGPTRIGADNVFFPYSTVGVASQDLKYHGEHAETRIGDRNRVREFVTIHRGTEGGGAVTELGDDNLLMAYAHVAHDCRIGSHAILGHAATLGGHVMVGDYAGIGAGTAVHQFCRIGRHCYIGGFSVVTQDVMPYSLTVATREIKVFGANRTGMERRDFPTASIEALQTAFRLLTRAGLNTSQAVEKIRGEVAPGAEVNELLEFIRTSERGCVK